MKTDIILAGVGGQGILSVAAIVGHAAVAEGLYLKQAETHGMSQRELRRDFLVVTVPHSPTDPYDLVGFFVLYVRLQ